MSFSKHYHDYTYNLRYICHSVNITMTTHIQPQIHMSFSKHYHDYTHRNICQLLFLYSMFKKTDSELELLEKLHIHTYSLTHTHTLSHTYNTLTHILSSIPLSYTPFLTHILSYTNSLTYTNTLSHTHTHSHTYTHTCSGTHSHTHKDGYSSNQVWLLRLFCYADIFGICCARW